MMIKSEKKLKDLALLLAKANPSLVAKAIDMLRDEEPFEGAVGLLVSCYDTKTSIPVRKAIESFFNDLKDKELRNEIVNEIKKAGNHGTLTMLVSSCWQSGMDYSGFATDFAEVFLKNDYSVAFECFTVIEGIIPELGRNKKEALSALIRRSLGSAGPKKPLYLELISLLKD